MIASIPAFHQYPGACPRPKVAVFAALEKLRGHPLEIPSQAGKANSFGFSQPNHFSP
jgi:hypothetical protein